MLSWFPATIYHNYNSSKYLQADIWQSARISRAINHVSVSHTRFQYDLNGTSRSSVWLCVCPVVVCSFAACSEIRDFTLKTHTHTDTGRRLINILEVWHRVNSSGWHSVVIMDYLMAFTHTHTNNMDSYTHTPVWVFFCVDTMMSKKMKENLNKSRQVTKEHLVCLIACTCVCVYVWMVFFILYMCMHACMYSIINKFDSPFNGKYICGLSLSYKLT